MMNRFRVDILKGKTESGVIPDQVHFIIDDTDLVDMLMKHEAPFAFQEGHPHLAGAYAGLSAKYTDVVPFQTNASNISLLDCTCGVEGCWPFTARITVTDTSVKWSDFEQPNRTSTSPAGLWEYGAFGPFEFEGDLYRKEIAKIKRPNQAL